MLSHSWSTWISTLEDRKYFENISYYINLGLKEKQNQVATKAKPWRSLTSWTLTTKTTVWWSRAFHSESRMMRSLSFSAAVELSLLTKFTLTKSMAENQVQLSWSLKILMQFKRLNLVSTTLIWAEEQSTFSTATTIFSKRHAISSITESEKSHF